MIETEKHSRWKQPKLWAPVALFFFVVISAIVFHFAGRSQVNREIATIRARGVPVTEVELDRWYAPVPAAENAALLYLEAVQSYISPQTNEVIELRGSDAVLGQALHPDVVAAVQDYLAANQETLKKIHHAASFTNSRYPVDFTKGFRTLLPHLGQIKRLGELMRWEAIEESRRGNRKEALQALKSGLTLAESLNEEPLFISAMVRIAMVSVWLKALERVVTEHRLEEAELTEFIDLIARAEAASKRSMQRGLSGERTIGIPLFRGSYRTYAEVSGGFGTKPEPIEFPELMKLALYDLRRALGMPDRDLSFYLARMGEMEMAMEKDYPQMLRDMEAADRNVQEGKPKWMKHLVSGLLLPAIMGGPAKNASLVSQLRCARAALAIERVRLQKGMKVLDEEEATSTALPEWPRDPFDNEPLRYEKLSKGYRVVSIKATVKKQQAARNTNLAAVAFTVMR
jgi:hypothetical protein